MLHFWETVIRPTLEAIEPRSVVEIGSDRGDNTRNLLEFCRDSEAMLHVIDPLPKYEISEWQEEYGDTFVPHLSLSLEVLPELEGMDLVLVDGDHNWYTVFNELKTIEKRCAELSIPFPLVLLHDIGWPYGRRDLYYSPENIPQNYQNPHAQKGLFKDSSELAYEGGLNPHLHNAVHDNLPQNGVLTAIEDFLDDTDESLSLIKLPGIYGLAMLIRTDLEEDNKKLAGLLQELRLTPIVAQHVEKVEEVRVEAMIRASEAERYSKEQERRASKLEKALSRQGEQLREQHREELESLRDDLRRQQEEDSRKIRELRQSLSRYERSLADRDESLRQKSRDLARLTQWMEQIEKITSAILNSRRWKMGHALGELRRKALRDTDSTQAPESLNKIFQRFHEWHNGSRHDNE